MSQRERRRLPSFGTIKDLARNRLSKRVATEASVSALTAIPIFWGVGPAAVGTINMVNAGIELHDTNKRKKGASYTRAATYAAFGLFEYGLLFAGTSILGPLEGKAFHHFGLETPDFLNTIGGALSSGLVGMITGSITNTTWYEAKRKGLIPYTPADVIFPWRLRKGRRR